jgi:CRP-like cAMP-binding protein
MDRAQLKGLPLLGSLVDEALDAVLPMLERRFVPAGSCVCRTGDPAEHVYVVVAGDAEVLMELDGEVLLLSVVQAPSFFGLMGVLEEMPRTATIRATTDLDLVMMPKAVLDILHARGKGELERFYQDALNAQSRDLRSANAVVAHHYREKIAEQAQAIARIQELYNQTLSLARARERIVNHVSHEIKTPLAILSGTIKVVGNLIQGNAAGQRDAALGAESPAVARHPALR